MRYQAVILVVGLWAGNHFLDAAPPRRPKPAESPATSQPVPAATSQPASVPIVGMSQEDRILTLPADQAYDQILSMLWSGQQPLAEKWLDRLIERYPDDQPIRFVHAVCERSRFDIDESRKLFEHVRKLDPTSIQGRCAEIVMDIDGAEFKSKRHINRLDTLIQESGESPLLLWVGGYMCRTLDFNERGVDYYQRMAKAIEPNEGPALMHQTWANLLDKLKRYDESLIHRHIAVRQSPAGWSYQGMGNTYYSLKQYDKAADAFEKAALRAPTDAGYWYSWATALEKQKEWDKACQKYEMAVRLDSRNAKYWRCWGDSFYEMKQYEKACEKYQIAVELNPKDAIAWRWWAYSCNELKKYGEALPKAQKAVELNPQSASSWYCHGWTLMKLERYDELIHSAQKAVELDSKHAWYWWLWGFGLEKTGQLAEAVEKYDQSIACAPYDRYMSEKSYQAKIRILTELGREQDAKELQDRLDQIKRIESEKKTSS